MCGCMFFYIVKASRPVLVDSVTHFVPYKRLNMSIAMHSAGSKHRIKAVSKNAQFYFFNLVEGRLKSLKIQH